MHGSKTAFIGNFCQLLGQRIWRLDLHLFDPKDSRSERSRHRLVVWVLLDVAQQLFARPLLTGPLDHIERSFYFLQSFELHLVFLPDLCLSCCAFAQIGGFESTWFVTAGCDCLSEIWHFPLAGQSQCCSDEELALNWLVEIRKGKKLTHMVATPDCVACLNDLSHLIEQV